MTLSSLLRASILLAAAAASMQGRAAPTLPTRADVASLFLAEQCYTLRIEVTRLGDLVNLPATEIPYCVELPRLVATGDCAPLVGNPVYEYSCPVALADPTQRYLRLRTSRTAFASYFVLGQPEAMGLNRGPFLDLTTIFAAQDVWSYRLTQILTSHKDELPLAFASLILPSDGNATASFGGTSRMSDAATHAVEFVLGWDYPYNHGAFASVQAVGYDGAGAEYGVHITSKLDRFTRPQP
jgi:hypothetical protein